MSIPLARRMNGCQGPFVLASDEFFQLFGDDGERIWIGVLAKDMLRNIVKANRECNEYWPRWPVFCNVITYSI